LNLFILDPDPIISAQLQCDKHVVKMIVESAQMLSTTHRTLDGLLETRKSKSGKTNVKYWVLPDKRENILYKSVHVGHPCTVWSTLNKANYNWHYTHFIALCNEYTYRYGKKHKTETELAVHLMDLPKNIPDGKLTKQPLAMTSNPECMNQNDIVGSYRAFYQTKQHRFTMKWTKRSIPDWFKVLA
jgi:hypothetical protein